MPLYGDTVSYHQLHIIYNHFSLFDCASLREIKEYCSLIPHLPSSWGNTRGESSCFAFSINFALKTGLSAHLLGNDPQFLLATTSPVCLCTHFSSYGRFPDHNGVRWGKVGSASVENEYQHEPALPLPSPSTFQWGQKPTTFRWHWKQVRGQTPQGGVAGKKGGSPVWLGAATAKAFTQSRKCAHRCLYLPLPPTMPHISGLALLDHYTQTDRSENLVF